MAANASAETITRFYTAFQQLDGETMQSCYAPDAVFQDAVFALRGRESIGNMWKMLCESTQKNGRDHWKLTFSDTKVEVVKDEEAEEADNTDGAGAGPANPAAAGSIVQGSAHWEADYLFSKTGRLVHNIIDAHFTFTQEGLIATHRDSFDFWAWSRQALGTTGWLLGWTSFLQEKVQSQAAASLERYVAGRHN